MGVSAEQAKTAVRVSLGMGNTEAELDSFLAWLRFYCASE
jgi:cysteine sulfinate desulfinase/cysteine desulfurase-like protein